MSSRPPRRRRPPEVADPSATVRPSKRAATRAAAVVAAERPTEMAILRFIRERPNRFVDLSPLAVELGVEPFEMQLTVERMGRRRLLNLPFVEPGAAGGAELTEKGLRELIAHEGGRSQEVPQLLQQATTRVRQPDEAPRRPRAEVYGPRD